MKADAGYLADMPQDVFDRWAAEGAERSRREQQGPLETLMFPGVSTAAADQTPQGEDFRAQFHKTDSHGSPTSIFDYAIREHVKGKGLFVMGGVPWVYDGGVYREDRRGTKVKKMIEDCIYPQFLTTRNINRVYELIICDDDIQRIPENINQYDPKLVPFKNGLYDPVTEEWTEYRRDHYCINQIPHEYHGSVKNSPVLNAWLNHICPRADDLEMLLEYIGVMLSPYTKFQKSLFLLGRGGTGKSVLINLVSYIVGSDNVSSVSFADLQQRFYPAQMFGKLVNVCGDIEPKALEDATLFKRMVGEDKIMYERKGKDGEGFFTYARLMYSANELPIVKNENTNGFYRRLMILPMNRVVEHPDPELLGKLKEAVPELLTMAMQSLQFAHIDGRIHESDTSRAEVEKFWNNSDSVQAFISECCTVEDGRRIQKKDIKDAYYKFCGRAERPSVGRNELYSSLRVKGFEEVKIDGLLYYKGIDV